MITDRFIVEGHCRRLKYAASDAHNIGCFVPRQSGISQEAKNDLVSARISLESAIASIDAVLEANQ